MSKVRVRMPAVRGTTTKRTTDTISVVHGMVIPPIPSNSATMGVKAIRMIRSLVATWTTV